MSVAKYLNDGNYRLAQQVGCDEWSTPFSGVGDQLSFEVKRKYRIAEQDYKRTAPMTKLTTRKGPCYMVEESEASNIGLGILEYTLTFASVPVPRTEYTSIAYAKQFLGTGDEPTVIEVVQTVPAAVEYEYSLKLLTPILAPTLEIINGEAVAIAGWGRFVAGKYYPAEDSQIGLHKSKIFFRRTIYIRWTAGVLVP